MTRGAWLALLALVGCTDDLTPPQEVDRVRVEAARLELPERPDAATLLPGDGFRLELLLSYPREIQRITHAAAACLSLPTGTATRLCAGLPFWVSPVIQANRRDEAQRVMCSDRELVEGAPDRLWLPPLGMEPARVPGATELGGLSEVLVAGAVCVNGRAEVDLDRLERLREQLDSGADPGSLEVTDFTELVVCEDDVPDDDRSPERLLWTHSLPVEREAEGGNQHTDLDSAAFELDGEPWPQPCAGYPHFLGCAAEAETYGLPLVRAADGDRQIRVVLDPGMRETAPDVDEPELLRLSHASNVGQPERFYSFVERDSSELDLVVTWEPPDGVQPAGVLTRLYFVLDDERNGFDWAVREFCLVP